MTLILGAVGRVIRGFHASDRLVSVPVTRKNPDGAHYIRSNKTVIVVGADCWIVLGYTRLAYLDGKPTDQYTPKRYRALTTCLRAASISGDYRPACTTARSPTALPGRSKMAMRAHQHANGVMG